MSVTPPSPLVGRERELTILRAHLRDAVAGRGSLALISGEAGIGKTALAETVGREAALQGALVLVGRCYDLSETPPYGPWLDLFERVPTNAPASPPDAFATRDGSVAAASQAALFRDVRDWLARTAAVRPLVLLLDDFHWADAASVDLLRFLARDLATLPVFALATYRNDDLPRQHPLATLLPALVREAGVARVEMRRLTRDDTRALVRGRYRLGERDAERLTGYLHERAEGNPFFTGELLRTLEEETILQITAAGETLGSLEAIRVPPLVRQVIEGRLARLEEEARRLLAVAAVIGHEGPFALWETVTDADSERLLEVAERGVDAHLLAVTEDGAGMRFVHALMRETLYEGMLPPRRREWHRRVAEALLAAGKNPDPDIVAFHLQQAGDPRAAVWLARAGERAQRAYAWLTAADRFAAAAAIAGEISGSMLDCDELLLRAAFLRRYAAPDDALPYIEEALQRVTDPAIRAQLLVTRGSYRSFLGDVRRGVSDLEAAMTAFETLSPRDRVRLREWLDAVGSPLEEYNPAGVLTILLAGTGRYAEALAMGAIAIAYAAEIGMPRAAYTAHFGIGYYHAALGDPAAAHEAFRRAQEDCAAVGHYFQEGLAITTDLMSVTLPYEADHPAAVYRLADAGATVWDRVGDAGLSYQVHLARLPVLFVAGEWAEARRIGLITRATGGPSYYFIGHILGPLARASGDAALGAAIVHDMLPNGVATALGTAILPMALVLQRLAVALALDTGDLDAARQWLEAHDRWLAWSGAVLGRAEGALGWSAYYRATGDPHAAEDHARQAHAHASEPRQPLALLAAHRALGELLTDTARYDEARDHLDAALALADACAAPFERALTLLAQAELHNACGETDTARALLDAVRAICTPLGAAPTLARADALVARLTPDTTASPAYPHGLSVREVEVLCLVTGGKATARSPPRSRSASAR